MSPGVVPPGELTRLAWARTGSCDRLARTSGGSASPAVRLGWRGQAGVLVTESRGWWQALVTESRGWWLTIRGGSCLTYLERGEYAIHFYSIVFWQHSKRELLLVTKLARGDACLPLQRVSTPSPFPPTDLHSHLHGVGSVQKCVLYQLLPTLIVDKDIHPSKRNNQRYRPFWRK